MLSLNFCRVFCSSCSASVRALTLCFISGIWMSQGLVEPRDLVHACLLLFFVLLGVSSGCKQGNEMFLKKMQNAGYCSNQ